MEVDRNAVIQSTPGSCLRITISFELIIPLSPTATIFSIPNSFLSGHRPQGPRRVSRHGHLAHGRLEGPPPGRVHGRLHARRGGQPGKAGERAQGVAEHAFAAGPAQRRVEGGLLGLTPASAGGAGPHEAGWGGWLPQCHRERLEPTMLAGRPAATTATAVGAAGQRNVISSGWHPQCQLGGRAPD